MEKVLLLTLSKQPFEVMITGEKRDEYRRESDWILSRLYDKEGNDKEYTHVKFVNGYGSDKPYFIAEFKGWRFECEDRQVVYSNGLAVDIWGGKTVSIQLGKITERGNYETNVSS